MNCPEEDDTGTIRIGKIEVDGETHVVIGVDGSMVAISLDDAESVFDSIGEILEEAGRFDDEDKLDVNEEKVTCH